MASAIQPLLLDIPEVVETERLLLRATRAGMGEAISQAVNESLAQLKPWRPWAQEPPSPEDSETEFTRALVRFSRSALGACRLEICCDARNAASRRVAEKSGFTLEGIHRSRRRDVSGELADSCMYAHVL